MCFVVVESRHVIIFSNNKEDGYNSILLMYKNIHPQDDNMPLI